MIYGTVDNESNIILEEVDTETFEKITVVINN